MILNIEKQFNEMVQNSWTNQQTLPSARWGITLKENKWKWGTRTLFIRTFGTPSLTNSIWFFMFRVQVFTAMKRSLNCSNYENRNDDRRLLLTQLCSCSTFVSETRTDFEETYYFCEFISECRQILNVFL